MFAEYKEVRVPGHKAIGAAFYGRGQAFEIIGVANRPLGFETPFYDIGERLELSDATVQLLWREAHEPLNPWTLQGASQLIHEAWGENQSEGIIDEALEQPSWDSSRADEPAHDDVGVEHHAKHELLPRGFLGSSGSSTRLANLVLCLEGDLHRVVVRELFARSLLLPREEILEPLLRRSAHLLQALDRHERSQGPALALDHELVVTKRDPVKYVADPGTNLHR
jgi:hypothetical protein